MSSSNESDYSAYVDSPNHEVYRQYRQLSNYFCQILIFQAGDNVIVRAINNAPSQECWELWLTPRDEWWAKPHHTIADSLHLDLKNCMYLPTSSQTLWKIQGMVRMRRDKEKFEVLQQMKGKMTGDLIERGEKTIQGTNYIIRIYRNNKAAEYWFDAFPKNSHIVPGIAVASMSWLQDLIDVWTDDELFERRSELIEYVQIRDGRIWLGKDPGVYQFKLPPSLDRDSESESSELYRKRSDRYSVAPSPHQGNTGRTSVLNSPHSAYTNVLHPPQNPKSKRSSKHSITASSIQSQWSGNRKPVSYDRSVTAPLEEEQFSVSRSSMSSSYRPVHERKAPSIDAPSKATYIPTPSVSQAELPELGFNYSLGSQEPQSRRKIGSKPAAKGPEKVPVNRSTQRVEKASSRVGNDKRPPPIQTKKSTPKSPGVPYNETTRFYEVPVHGDTPRSTDKQESEVSSMVSQMHITRKDNKSQISSQAEKQKARTTRSMSITIFPPEDLEAQKVESHSALLKGSPNKPGNDFPLQKALEQHHASQRATHVRQPSKDKFSFGNNSNRQESEEPAQKVPFTKSTSYPTVLDEAVPEIPMKFEVEQVTPAYTQPLPTYAQPLPKNPQMTFGMKNQVEPTTTKNSEDLTIMKNEVEPVVSRRSTRRSKTVVESHCGDSSSGWSEVLITRSNHIEGSWVGDSCPPSVIASDRSSQANKRRSGRFNTFAPPPRVSDVNHDNTEDRRFETQKTGNFTHQQSSEMSKEVNRLGEEITTQSTQTNVGQSRQAYTQTGMERKMMVRQNTTVNFSSNLRQEPASSMTTLAQQTNIDAQIPANVARQPSGQGYNSELVHTDGRQLLARGTLEVLGQSIIVTMYAIADNHFVFEAVWNHTKM